MKRIHVVLSVIVLALVIHLPAQAALKDLQLQTANVNGVRIAWAEVGNPEGAPVLMIMGLGASHQVWGEPMINGLVKEGYRVILIDNRDVGGSQKFSDQGQPVIWWNLLKNQLGFSVTTVYTLDDMARPPTRRHAGTRLRASKPLCRSRSHSSAASWRQPTGCRRTRRRRD